AGVPAVVPLLLRLVEPEALALPRVRGEGNAAARRVERVPTHDPPEREQGAQAAQHHRLLVFLAAQGREHGAFLAEVAQPLLYRREKDGVRAQLDEDRV